LFEKCSDLSRAESRRTARCILGNGREGSQSPAGRKSLNKTRYRAFKSREDPAKSREAPLGDVLASDYHILVIRQTDSDVLGFLSRLHLENVLLALHDHGHHGDAVLGFYAACGRPEAVLRSMAACVKWVFCVLRLQHTQSGDEFTQRESMRGALARVAQHPFIVRE